METREVDGFRSIFDQEFGYVWNTLRRLGIHEADLKDQTQEVFLTVSAILADYDPARPMRPWLFGIAYRVAGRYRERIRRSPRVVDATPDPMDERPAADEQLADAEERQMVLDAILQIEIHRRAVFTLAEIDERPMPDIADAIGIPLNTAYSRLRLARADFGAAMHRLRARDRVAVRLSEKR